MLLIVKIRKMNKIFVKHEKNLKQLSRYLIVGGSSAIIEVLLLYAMTNFAGLFYLHSSVMSFLLVAVYGFLMQKHFTFNNKNKSIHIQFPVFLIATLIGLVLNTFFVYFFVDKLGIYYVFAKIFAIGIVLIWNFFTQKFIVFK